FEVERQLPANLTIVGQANREYRYEADRAAVAALLDRGVELGQAPLKMHLLRGSFRLDHGDPTGAAADMRVVADLVGTPYAAALAERYAEVPSGGKGADAVDRSGLPTPTSVEDHFLVGYHYVRADEDATGIPILARPDVRELPLADELYLTLRPIGPADGMSHFERAFQDYQEVVALEARIGGRTAGTAHAAGRFLDEMGRYDKALECLEEGIALAERSHVLRINAGFAAFGLQRYDVAREHLEVAIDLRPAYVRPLLNLTWVLIELGEFDEALARIEAAPLPDDPGHAQWRLLAKASVETRRALAERQAGQMDESQASVQRAAGYLSAAEALGPVRLDADVAIQRGLEAGNEEAILHGLTMALLKDPHNTWALGDLIELLPEDLSAAGTASVKAVLEVLDPRLLVR
ncbi:MAG: tetratricopeptide repeat protein, partial [Planctomycetota bacterium]|nr:tetratricopeptide repeat protein [Planctomycetota bacterium]